MHAGSVTGWLMAALLGLILYFAYGTITSLEAEKARLSDDLAKANTQLDRARKGAQRAAQDAQSARLKLKEALDANPEWRDAAVPDAVRDSLCERIKCAKPRPLPAPEG